MKTTIETSYWGIYLDKLSENNLVDKKLRKTEIMNLQTKITQLMDKLGKKC